jgi:hypothetical protein
VLAKWPHANMNTLNATLVLCSVNQPSRVHYPKNKKPRLAKDHRYDFLFSLGRGQVELYDPERHGQWEIRRNEYGGLEVGQTDLETGLSLWS